MKKSTKKIIYASITIFLSLIVGIFILSSYPSEPTIPVEPTPTPTASPTASPTTPVPTNPPSTPIPTVTQPPAPTPTAPPTFITPTPTVPPTPVPTSLLYSNILINPSFETIGGGFPLGWYQGIWSTTSTLPDWVAENPNSGLNSIKFYYPGLLSQSGGYLQVKKPVPVLPNTQYTAGIYRALVSVGGGTMPFISVNEINSANQIVKLNRLSLGSGTSPYTEYKTTFTTTSSTVSIIYEVFFTDAHGTMYVDDLSLYRS